MDEVSNTHVSYSGLMPRTFQDADSEGKRALKRLSQPRVTGYSKDLDRLWTLSPDAKELSVDRSNVMSRDLVAGLTLDLEGRIASEAHELKAAVDAELARR